jgi:hypothetical protein
MKPLSRFWGHKAIQVFIDRPDSFVGDPSQAVPQRIVPLRGGIAKEQVCVPFCSRNATDFKY